MAAATSKAATAIPNALSRPALAYTDTIGRAIHIKIHPRSINLSESRQILQKLKEYGEVVTYKHLKHEPEVRAANTVLAIFRSKDDASRCISASPLSLRVGDAAPPAAAITAPRSEGTTQNPQDTGQLLLYISASSHNHAAYISRQHYTSRFQMNTRTVMGADLQDRVPITAMADCRVEVGEVPLRLRNLRREEEKREKRGAWKEGLGVLYRQGLREREERGEKGAKEGD